jgi:hypothetical protein
MGSPDVADQLSARAKVPDAASCGSAQEAGPARRRIRYAPTVDAMRLYNPRSGEFDIIEEGLEDYL